MDESLNNTLQSIDAEIDGALREQRDQARQFLSKWKEGSTGTEHQLLQQLNELAYKLANESETGESGQLELQRKQDEIALREQQLREREKELAAREATLQEQAQSTFTAQERLNERIDQLQATLDELDQRRTAAQQAEAELAARQHEHQAAQQEIDKKQAELKSWQQRLDEQANSLTKNEESIRQRELQTSESRRQLAKELKRQRREHLAEVERRRAELEQIAASEDSELEARIAQFQAELERMRQQTEADKKLNNELCGQLDAAQAENRDLLTRLEEIAANENRNSVEAAELSAELAEARERVESQYAASEAALKQARQEQQDLQQELEQKNGELDGANNRIVELEQRAESLGAQIAAASDEASAQRIRELESERDALVERLSDAEQMSGVDSGSNNAEFEELQRRYETAMSEIRDLRIANAKHEERNAASGMPAGGMDWEAQKQRMLAQLEADYDEDDPEEAANRLTVEGAIQMTDQAVAEKEREIEELRRLLDEQSKNLGDVAVGASAIAEMLDSDELVKQEREKLEMIQQEWREKLRKAEIDISVERAKIARERAQLEEKIQMLEQRSISGGDGESAESETPKRGKWLARLGLGDGN